MPKMIDPAQMPSEWQKIIHVSHLPYDPEVVANLRPLYISWDDVRLDEMGGTWVCGQALFHDSRQDEIQIQFWRVGRRSCHISLKYMDPDMWGGWERGLDHARYGYIQGGYLQVTAFRE